MEESEEKRGRGRPKKERPKLNNPPALFEPDEEFDLTEMQTAFVYWYTEGACGASEAARRAGFAYPSSSASRMLDGKSQPNVVKAIRARQEEMRSKYAITPEKTGKMLWEITQNAFDAGHYNAAVSAVKELNNLAGLTIHRTQNLNINANLDKMTKADITKRLNELLGVDDSFSDKDH
jgi:hypothetical protein